MDRCARHIIGVKILIKGSLELWLNTNCVVRNTAIVIPTLWESRVLRV